MKQKVSWITSAMRHSVNEVKTAVHGLQHVNSPLKEKFKMQPSAGKEMYAAFWDRKGVIPLSPHKSSTLTITLQFWLS